MSIRGYVVGGSLFAVGVLGAAGAQAQLEAKRAKPSDPLELIARGPVNPPEPRVIPDGLERTSSEAALSWVRENWGADGEVFKGGPVFAEGIKGVQGWSVIVRLYSPIDSPSLMMVQQVADGRGVPYKVAASRLQFVEIAVDLASEIKNVSTTPYDSETAKLTYNDDKDRFRSGRETPYS